MDSESEKRLYLPNYTGSSNFFPKLTLRFLIFLRADPIVVLPDSEWSNSGALFAIAPQPQV